MPEMRAYPESRFCWIDLQAKRLDVAKDFYGKVFGWTFEDEAGEGFVYTMCRSGGRLVAGMSQMQPEMVAAGMPSMWTTYVNVSDAGGVAERAGKLGAQVPMPPMQIVLSDGTVQGTLALMADPAGAMIGLWQAGDHKGSELIGEPCSLCWCELTTRDVAPEIAFYTELFGWEVVDQPMGPMTYREIRDDGDSVGGVMEMTDDWPADIPSHWMNYIAVEDTDAAAEAVTEAGGSVPVPPTDIPPGRFAVVNDPDGGWLSILRLTEEMS